MGERSQPVDVLSEPLVTATVTTHDPSKYTLHNSEDGTVWQMGDDGRWKRAAATPDGAGRIPIDVAALALALCDDDDSLYYVSERHDRSSCGHRTQAARLAARVHRLSLLRGAVNSYDRLRRIEAAARGPVLGAFDVLASLREVARQAGNADLIGALEPARHAEAALRTALGED
jgi:hypothetical protein